MRRRPISTHRKSRRPCNQRYIAIMDSHEKSRKVIETRHETIWGRERTNVTQIVGISGRSSSVMFSFCAGLRRSIGTPLSETESGSFSWFLLQHASIGTRDVYDGDDWRETPSLGQ